MPAELRQIYPLRVFSFADSEPSLTATANSTGAALAVQNANDAASNVGEENLGVRGLSVYDHEYLISNQLITKISKTIQVLLPNGDTTDTNILQRFPLCKKS